MIFCKCILDRRSANFFFFYPNSPGKNVYKTGGKRMIKKFTVNKTVFFFYLFLCFALLCLYATAIPSVSALETDMYTDEAASSQNDDLEIVPMKWHIYPKIGYCPLDNGYQIQDYNIHYGNYHPEDCVNIEPVNMIKTYRLGSTTAKPVDAYKRLIDDDHIQTNIMKYDIANDFIELSISSNSGTELNPCYEINDDNYSGEIKGLEEFGKARVGYGRLMVKIVNYKDGIAQSPQLLSYTNCKTTFKFLTVKQECDVYLYYVYEVHEIPANIFQRHTYHNMRVEYRLQFRNRSTKIGLKEASTNSELLPDDNNNSYTKNGFKIDIMGNNFYTIATKLNDGSYENRTIQQLKNQSFTTSGKWTIKITNAWEDTAEYIVYVDKQAPTAYINGNNLMNYSNMDGKYLAFTGTPTVTWDTSAYTAPITATYQKDNGTVQTLSNGQVLTKGTYKITLSKPTGLETVYYVKVDDYIPNKNYLLLKDNETYKSMLNRYQTKLWAVNVGTEVRGFGDYDVALEAAYDYEWSLVSQNSDGTLSYRTQTYSTNEALTLAMEPYAKANVQRTYYNIETPNLSLTENAYDGQILYLNGFKFIYNENAVFSQEVRYYKLSDLETTIDENVKLKARNGNILPYNTLVDTILSTSGRYVIYEKNIFGNEYFYEVYFVNENTSSVTMEYSFNDQSLIAILDQTKNGSNFSVTSFKLSNFENALDPFCEIIIQSNDYFKILIPEDLETDWIITNGVYQITFIDRNSNKFEITVNVQGEPYLIDGVPNFSENINIAVTIKINSDCTINLFTINGEEKTITEYFNTTEQNVLLGTFQPQDAPYSIFIMLTDDAGTQYTIALSFS